MKSNCCNAETIQGGLLDNTRVLICTRCKKPVKEVLSYTERDVVAYRNASTDLNKKLIKLKEENLKLKEYIKKLEKFSKKEKEV